MKLKNGYLALAAALAFSAPAAFSQSSLSTDAGRHVAPEDESGKTVSPAKDGNPISDPAAEYNRATEPSEQEARPKAEAPVEQRAAVEEPATRSPTDQSMSSSQYNQPARTNMSQAQAEVPPPVDSNTVRGVQQALSEQGHKVKADGIWGEKTHQALMDFQREKNLKASGQLDAETFAALHMDGESQTASAAGRSGGSSSSGSSR
ncbi:MAG TPA: peptidoglycan-binding protein [Gammaproteobacteria bacterium]|nr:peptidoglycan-binding protein [Gammaproteobacteria bacterium]